MMNEPIEVECSFESDGRVRIRRVRLAGRRPERASQAIGPASRYRVDRPLSPGQHVGFGGVYPRFAISAPVPLVFGVAGEQ